MNTTTESPALEAAVEVVYPSSDGQPMAETPIHVDAVVLLYEALQDFFNHRSDVLVTADVLWYWEEGNANARRAPDVMVVEGVGRDIERRSFFSWQEGGAVPAAVFEIASEGTWTEDLGEKFKDYERLGVAEYFLFDPEAEYLRPSLQGFSLINGRYRLLHATADGSIESRLGLRLRAVGKMLRVIDGSTGSAVLTRTERAAEAESRAAEAEARLGEVETRIDEARAVAKEALAEAEEQRAHVERLELELQALRRQLGRTEGPSAP